MGVDGHSGLVQVLEGLDLIFYVMVLGLGFLKWALKGRLSHGICSLPPLVYLAKNGVRFWFVLFALAGFCRRSWFGRSCSGERVEGLSCLRSHYGWIPLNQLVIQNSFPYLHHP